MIKQEECFLLRARFLEDKKVRVKARRYFITVKVFVTRDYKGQVASFKQLESWLELSIRRATMSLPRRLCQSPQPLIESSAATAGKPITN